MAAEGETGPPDDEARRPGRGGASATEMEECGTDSSVRAEPQVTAAPSQAPDGSDTLATIAGKIDAFFVKLDDAEKKRDDYRITAGQLLIEAKRRVESGEAGNISWREWLKANVRRSIRDCNRVLRIAGAVDPKAALEKERAAAREGMAAKRVLQQAEAAGTNNGDVCPSDPKWDDLLSECGTPLEVTRLAREGRKVEQLDDDEMQRSNYVPPPAVFCTEVAAHPVPLIGLYWEAAQKGKVNIIDLAWAAYHAAYPGYQQEFVRRIAKPEQFEKAQALNTLLAAFGKLNRTNFDTTDTIAKLFKDNLTRLGRDELAKKLRADLHPRVLKKFVAALTDEGGVEPVDAADDLGLDDLQPGKPDEAGDPPAPKIPLPTDPAIACDPLPALQQQYTTLSDRLGAYDWVMRRLSCGETPEKDDEDEVAKFVRRFIGAPTPIQKRFRADIGDRPVGGV